MELPPRVPSPSPAASSVLTQAAGTSDDISVSQVWDWENLLNFTIEADDSSVLPWELPETSHPPSLQQHHSADPTTIIALTRVRKRDPRLVCANYLAGRIPCACPEMDEKVLEGDEDGSAVFGGRKRARAGVVNVEVRCQVPGCEADIRELKGYHRRHRVCLHCAIASAVMLDGEEKRYCQQCGKFHLLLDFDEGKRSCRRKLEKHNRRRRRKLIDSNSVAEKEIQPQADPLRDVFLDTDQILGTPKASACKDVDNDARNEVLDTDVFSDNENGNGFLGCSFNGLEQAQTNSPISFGASADARVDDRVDNPKSALSSTICDNKSSYSSMCPTGRISFKLYDWNPAEFPRQLRHQIFQWLASMPVELEGYIRPGCTILTIFIAMPRHMWEKLSLDGEFYIKQLIRSPQSLLSGRGNIVIYLGSMVLQILKDGTLHSKMVVNAPKLHFVYPTYFEAGEAVEFIACGSNLVQPKLRFLVSFAGKYLAGDACRLISHQKVRCPGINPEFSGRNYEHEMFRVTIKQTAPNIFGPAFIEVENESGISNFIPILIGNKQVCSELKSLHGTLADHSHAYKDNNDASNASFSYFNATKQISMSDLLLDIAWMLEEPFKGYGVSFFGSLNLQRLKHMLQFSMQNELINVLKAILKYVDAVIHELGNRNYENVPVSSDLSMLLECIKTAREFLDQRIQHNERSELDSWCTNLVDVLPINPAKIVSAIMTNANLAEERMNADVLNSSNSTVLSVEGEEFVSFSPHKESTSCLLSPSYYPYNHCSFPITSRRSSHAIFVVSTLFICFVICIILLDPFKVAGDLAVFIGRCAVRNSSMYS